MITYIAILRGINVGGHRKILMADLKLLLKKIGLKDCTTYIQSGNVVFSSNMSSNEIEKAIKEAIFKKYGFDVPVLIRTTDEIETVFSSNPFLPKETDINKLYVAFLAEKPLKEYLEKLKAIHFEDANYQIIGNHVYICYDTKVSNSKLTNNLIESKLKVTTTIRNWKTVTKLLEMSTKL
ncbi:DUF1697 domain-containing protein [Aureibaculum conchae]|uniref:DUF1697 domain-containing protein n=1 Tax=Aureibaculum sp. 2308TA14-22 TaxID=3108392 RepID=UPI0033982B48